MSLREHFQHISLWLQGGRRKQSESSQQSKHVVGILIYYSFLGDYYLATVIAAHRIISPMFQDLTTLVLDIGTHSARVGYGGDEAPKLDCPSKVAYSATMHDS